MVAIHSYRLTITVVAAVVLGGFVVSGVAVAGHNEPKIAHLFSSSLVRSYAPCTLPNDTTPNLGLPACTPAVPLDSVCGIDPNKGKGKVVAISLGHGDILVLAFARHLTGCDGEALTFVATTRTTTDNCTSGGDCTAVDVLIPVGTCTVSGGDCSIVTTANTELGPAFVQGNNAGIEILGCGLVRTTGSGAPAQTLSCGLLVK